METVIPRVKEDIAKSTQLPTEICLNSLFWKTFFSVYERLPHYLPDFYSEKTELDTHEHHFIVRSMCSIPQDRWKSDTPLRGHQQGSCNNAIFQTVKGRNKIAVSCCRTGLALWCPAPSCRKLNWEPRQPNPKANRVIGRGSGAVHLLHQPRLGAENSSFSFPWQR